MAPNLCWRCALLVLTATCLAGAGAPQVAGAAAAATDLGSAKNPLYMMHAEPTFKTQLWRTFRSLALTFLIISGEPSPSGTCCCQAESRTLFHGDHVAHCCLAAIQQVCVSGTAQHERTD